MTHKKIIITLCAALLVAGSGNNSETIPENYGDLL